MFAALIAVLNMATAVSVPAGAFLVAVSTRAWTFLFISLALASTATDLGACNAYSHGLEMARRLRMPVQLVLGEADRMTPVRATEELRQALPQAGLSLLDSGHALMQERPRELAQALLELLGRSGAPS